jgi:hypothetical protein
VTPLAPTVSNRCREARPARVSECLEVRDRSFGRDTLPLARLSDFELLAIEALHRALPENNEDEG